MVERAGVCLWDYVPRESLVEIQWCPYFVGQSEGGMADNW